MLLGEKHAKLLYKKKCKVKVKENSCRPQTAWLLQNQDLQ